MTDEAARFSCPIPPSYGDSILLAHGEGGRLSRQLITSIMARYFPNPHLSPLGDAAQLPDVPGPFAFTTDSYVVTPLFFPNTDIGELAVNGTVNDLVAAGAEPLWISLALIIEEGLPTATLERVLTSIAQAARQAKVLVVTGDTKVVPRGAADQLFINTSGIGRLLAPVPPGPAALSPNDVILVSGPLADHGLAVLSARENLGVEPAPSSDCRALIAIAQSLREHKIEVTALRDATRGGLAAVLHEWSAACGHTIQVDIEELPVRPATQALCDLLGMEPIFIANEGVLVMGLPASAATRAIDALRKHADCPLARVVARVVPRRPAPVTALRSFGPELALDEPPGAPLPRIC